MNTRACTQGGSRWLISSDLLDTDLAEQVCVSATGNDQPVVKYLVDNNILDSTVIAQTVSSQFGLPLLDLDALDPLAFAISAVKHTLIIRHRALPLVKKGDRLFLAVSDPSDDAGLSDIQFHTGCKLKLVIVEEHKLNAAIQQLLEHPQEETGHQADLDLDSFEPDTAEEEAESQSGTAVDETPVMRYVNKLLRDAIRHKVSDIHIELYENSSRIRFREDGLLREIARPPLPVVRKIASRLKIMAQLDISEKRLPQDGRFKISCSRTRAIDFRVSTLPTLWGEKTVLRVLDPGARQLDLEVLGFNEDQKSAYLQALNRQQGLILVTGPTGSGKSLSLYAGLNLLNSQERNIATAEDPVEIHLDGVNQVAVNPSVGLDFTEALRAFLRQDPDVLMVGEIRDLETARIAVKAAQTGHLVLSTLHTNNAPETITRLLDMGIPPYHLASSLSLILAQRLVRRLCNYCKKPLNLPPNILIQEGFLQASLSGIRLHAPAGCEKCQNGYCGRMGIYEAVPITDTLSHVIMSGGNSIQIAEIARKAGFNTLRDSGLEKAAQGLTSLAEVNRITWTGKQAGISSSGHD